MKRLGVIAAFAVTALLAPLARADEAACVASYEQTQILRKAGKLRDARAEAAKCADASCPGILTKDCSKWQTELDAQVATIVLDVKSGDGAPLGAVKVTANGQPLVDRVDATPIVVDPGTLALHFEGNGKTVDQSVTVTAGEKAHRVSVTLGAPTPAAKPLPLGPIVFGAVGVVAVGVGAVFAISGHSSESDLDACKGHCSAHDVNSVSTKYAVSDILFTAGAVSLVAAAYMFLTRPSEPAAPTVGLKRLESRGFVLEF